MVSDNVKQIVQRMAQFSAVAQELAKTFGIQFDESTASVSSDTADELTEDQKKIADLIAQVRDLTIQISEMSDELEQPRGNFTDEEQKAFVERLRTSLKDQPYQGMISFYDKRFFEALPKNVRVIVSQVLCDICTSRNFEPVPLWTSIVATNGLV